MEEAEVTLGQTSVHKFQNKDLCDATCRSCGRATASVCVCVCVCGGDCAQYITPGHGGEVVLATQLTSLLGHGYVFDATRNAALHKTHFWHLSCRRSDVS